jgi:uncharacterized protein
MERNVLGTPLQACSFDPLTGFLRDGCCSADEEDVGQHWVCVRMTAEFLAFSKSKGNDLSTPRHAYRFAGLKPTDRWCLCAARWLEAYEAGAAPPVVLEATHAKTLECIPLAVLQQHAYPKSTASH